MEFYYSNKIRVVNPTPELIRWCKENLIIPNPDYAKLVRLGKWTGNTPQHIWLFEQNGNEIYIQAGCIEKLRSWFGATSPFYTDIRSFERINYQSGIKLYEYQENAVREAILHLGGVIVMPCGAGKTQTALELISRIGGKCLWLTHTQDLLNQSISRAKSVLGIDNSSYGTITGGKVRIGSGITFATIQTMCKLDLAQYKHTWDMIVVDECHKAVGSPTKVMQFYKVLSNLACKYKFGLTATPYRADKLEVSMFSLLGGIIYEVSSDEVAHTTCPVKVSVIRTEYTPNLDVVLAGDGTIVYASLVNDLIRDEHRLNRISSTINNYCRGKTLVLANRIEYLERLQACYNGKSVCLSTLGNTKAAKAQRKKALQQLDAGEIDCVFATYQLAKEGLDIPHLRYIVFATPEKDETTITQSAGRVGRKADGKDFGEVIDFVDGFGMLKGWAKTRQRYYRKLGYEIEELY